jgi:hypothetical protein
LACNSLSSFKSKLSNISRTLPNFGAGASSIALPRQPDARIKAD